VNMKTLDKIHIIMPIYVQLSGMKYYYKERDRDALVSVPSLDL